MSRYHSYINSAKEILGIYSGTEPFSSFLKKYFAANKKFGSKDRKQISHLCYCYFRLGRAVMNLPVEERILKGLFLSSVDSNKVLETANPDWDKSINISFEEKCLMLNIQCSTIFHWKKELSEDIDHEKFCESFLIQPDLFIRIRPPYAEAVFHRLKEAGVKYEFISPSAIRLPNSFKVDQYFEPDKEIVIQDLNSQQIAHLLPVDPRKPLEVWDCCAASGGKSIMAYDINQDIQLTVSDIRESILSNLKKRFQQAGIKNYQAFVADLTKPQSPHTSRQSLFDLIIADVPCTGSGTWGRTPEQLFYFDERKIEEYGLLQKKIISNVIPHIKPGGYLLYITCSVFKKENEENVSFIRENFHLEPIRVEVLKGYDNKADTLFAALFKQSL